MKVALDFALLIPGLAVSLYVLGVFGWAVITTLLSRPSRT